MQVQWPRSSPHRCMVGRGSNLVKYGCTSSCCASCHPVPILTQRPCKLSWSAAKILSFSAPAPAFPATLITSSVHCSEIFVIRLFKRHVFLQIFLSLDTSCSAFYFLNILVV